VFIAVCEVLPLLFPPANLIFFVVFLPRFPERFPNQPSAFHVDTSTRHGTSEAARLVPVTEVMAFPSCFSVFLPPQSQAEFTLPAPRSAGSAGPGVPLFGRPSCLQPGLPDVPIPRGSSVTGLTRHVVLF